MISLPAPWLAPLFVGLFVSGATASVAAQTVWRCGPDGRSFQATPCADGHPVALRPSPGADAVAEAHAVAAREREAVENLAAERRARHADALARGLGPAGIVPRAAPVVPVGIVHRHPGTEKNGSKKAKKKGLGERQPPWFRPLEALPRGAG